MKDFEGSDEMMIVDEVAHDWLFPRVATVVHHCGAGTTAAALRAGRPSVGVPFFGAYAVLDVASVIACARRSAVSLRFGTGSGAAPSSASRCAQNV